MSPPVQIKLTTAVGMGEGKEGVIVCEDNDDGTGSVFIGGWNDSEVRSDDQLPK